ncbi:hypothetical protein DPMN_085612 [Dreissena polymorpha]|uniref:J domain-containing protein n=1 Tax=Dreissena polymorpha TaxID=45954 RepID=A0A9D4BJK7_DREPO|nr:hypothetical protein DPMN_085612 [Dreissena polymorpha]
MPENYYEIFCSGVQQLVERKILTEQWVIDLKEARQKSEGSVDCSIDVLGFLKKEIFDIVWNYLAGKISIETCFSTVFDKIGEASGFAGQHVGSMVGTLIAMKFNIGVKVAAIVGAVAGKISAQILTDFIKNWMSRLMNKDIENAYALFGTDASASDKKIESCYKKRARKYHPYKCGDIVKWIQLKHAKALIDDARGKKAKKSG